MRKIVALILSLTVIAGILAGCDDTTPTTTSSGTTAVTSSVAAGTTAGTTVSKTTATTYSIKNEYTTLILGSDEFSGVFSPFFGESVYDIDVTNMTQEPLIRNTPEGAPMDGLAKFMTPVENMNADGSVATTVYTFTLKEGLKYSDGTPITADDILFVYKVYLDSAYDGPSTLFTVPIIGANEYYYDDVNYAVELEAITTEAKKISSDEVKAYIAKSCAEDYEIYGAAEINNYTGFKNPANLTGDALNSAVIQAFVDMEINYYWDFYKPSAIDAKKAALEDNYKKKNAMDGINVNEITGIKKISDRTVEVTINGVDPTAIWILGGISPVPASYYGKGYVKGDLSVVKALNNKPKGAGAYIFDSYLNHVVSFSANPYFYLGAPKIAKIKFQVIDTSDNLASIKLGDTDISELSCSPSTIAEVEAAGLHYETIMKNVYGYIGINAKRISDKNLRKGLMSLMNRAPSVRDFYGETAKVIERPMSTVSWAYPDGVKPFYNYSKTDAINYFQAAGYTQKQQEGKTMLVKSGIQLKIEIGIPGGENGTHPSFKILTQMKIDLEELGGVLEIRDVPNQMFIDVLNNDGWDMWCSTWDADIDPDMYQIYHSGQTNNHYSINDPKLDMLLEAGRKTNNIEKRKAIYAECLDIIMELAVEMPVYQHMNMYVFNPEIINIETLPKTMTPFFGYFAEIQTLELN